MSKGKYLPLLVVLLIALAFRFFIIYFLPINQISAGPLGAPFWLTLSLGLVNLTLLFSLFKKTNYKIGLLASLLYAISPWTAYLEIAGNAYIILLTVILIVFKISQMFDKNRRYTLIGLILILIIFIYKFNQVTIFSDVGLINSVNSFRGETNQTIFASMGKIIENRYIYLSKHVIFNILKQFTPATYFTNQQQLLGFSFAPPIYLGFIIPLVFSLFRIIRSFNRNEILKSALVMILLIPSVLSKEAPDLTRLIIISPVIFLLISSGLYEFIINYKSKLFRFFLILTISLVLLQFFTTLSDISIREPVRLQNLLG